MSDKNYKLVRFDHFGSSSVNIDAKNKRLPTRFE